MAYAESSQAERKRPRLSEPEEEEEEERSICFHAGYRPAQIANHPPVHLGRWSDENKPFSTLLVVKNPSGEKIKWKTSATKSASTWRVLSRDRSMSSDIHEAQAQPDGTRSIGASFQPQLGAYSQYIRDVGQPSIVVELHLILRSSSSILASSWGPPAAPRDCPKELEFSFRPTQGYIQTSHDPSSLKPYAHWP
ncbi:hypothetical protein C2E23DRAFT_862819 [Lenzites betulinus]|nr:hypothetical protein C2E23DRAFT_862819 [Lenzites betulinus]